MSDPAQPRSAGAAFAEAVIAALPGLTLTGGIALGALGYELGVKAQLEEVQQLARHQGLRGQGALHAGLGRRQARLQ